MEMAELMNVLCVLAAAVVTLGPCVFVTVASIGDALTADKQTEARRVLAWEDGR